MSRRSSTPDKLEQAQNIINKILKHPPTTMADLRRRTKPVRAAVGRQVLLQLIAHTESRTESPQTIALLAEQFKLVDYPEPLLQIIEDKTAAPAARRLALLVLASGNPAGIDPERLRFDATMMNEMAATAEGMLLSPILENPDLATEIATMLVALPPADRAQAVQRLDQRRRQLMVPSWLVYPDVLQTEELQQLHGKLIGIIAAEIEATGVDIWDDIMALNLSAETTTKTARAIMISRTARLNSGAAGRTPAPSFDAEATAWISQCDGVGAYVIMVCVDLENGQMNLHNVVLRTAGELRDGFVLADRSADTFEHITDVFREESGYKFVRLPLSSAQALVGEARTSPLNDEAADMRKTRQAAECMQWATAFGRETATEPRQRSLDQGKREKTYTIDELIDILEEDDFAGWFLNERDLSEFGIEIVPPQEADDDWTEAQARRLNTPGMCKRLGSMFTHMAEYYFLQQDDQREDRCITLAAMLDGDQDTSFLVLIHYFVHSLEVLRTSEIIGGDRESLAFGDLRDRQMLRQSCFPDLVEPLGKHMALLDLTEAAWLALEKEVGSLSVDQQPRHDTLPQIALAIAAVQVDRLLSDQQDPNEEPVADAEDVRQMIDTVCRLSGWQPEEATRIWQIMTAHLSSFLAEVCEYCPVQCFAAPEARLDSWFHADLHPAMSGEVGDRDDYYVHEEEFEETLLENEDLLIDFGGWLAEKGLVDSTIQKHIVNLDFYLNNYLLSESVWSAAEGITEVDGFLGFGLSRHTGWASPTAIKSNAASFKKFYRFMRERGLVTEPELVELLATIKAEMPTWLRPPSQGMN